MDIEKLKDEAATFLEEMHVSGDAMIDMDHCLDELPVDEHGSYYLHDVMTGFMIYLKKKQETRPHETIVMWRSTNEEMPSIKQPVLMAVECGSELKVEQGEYIGNGQWINCWFSKRDKNTYPVQFWKPLDKPKAT